MCDTWNFVFSYTVMVVLFNFCLGDFAKFCLSFSVKIGIGLLQEWILILFEIRSFWIKKDQRKKSNFIRIPSLGEMEN